MFHIVFVEPEIPGNTGNIARTCAATGAKLHLVRPLGFNIDDKTVKRAGLDYWQYVDVVYWENFEELERAFPEGKFYFFTTKARACYTDMKYCDGDFLVFGRETKGLPESLLISHPRSCVRIPMLGELRSLNLSNSVAIAVYEGLRQSGFAGMNRRGELHELKWDE